MIVVSETEAAAIEQMTRELIRTILKSRTYQLSSRSGPEGDREAKYFARYPARLLSAEQLLDAISAVTGAPEDFPGLPAGTRAGRSSAVA